jgi:uncharacterized hydrophobic protein (TIGR00271 family)
MEKKEKQSFWFEITKQDQYVAVNELMQEGGDKITYYILLILSSIIIASGVLLANSAILIGGMLITPLMTPVLLIGLGFTIGNAALLKRSVKKILQSVGLIFAISVLAALIFGVPDSKEFFSSAIFANSIKSGFLYFLVAFASGIAATYAWIRKKVDNMLPGISIAVSLVPPVAIVGIFLGRDAELTRFFLSVFLFNLVGIIGGSMILFSMFRFYHSSKIVEKKLREAEAEAEAQKKAKEEEKIKEALESITSNDDENKKEETKEEF